MSDVKWSKADEREARDFSTNSEGTFYPENYAGYKHGYIAASERAIEIVREVAETCVGSQEGMFDEIIRRLREGRKE